MHLAVCDDNITELSHISSLLEEYRRKRNNSITYETFHSATELLETLAKRRFDLLLLDILMPGVTGMEAAREIRRSDGEIPIIFLTSSREYAVESYRVSAGDYIMKPAREDEIFPALDRQLARLSQKEAYVTFRTGNGLAKLPYSQIVCVEVINRTLQFTLANGETRKTYGYLSEYENALLLDPAFFKPHRSYIVNLRQVTELDKSGFSTTVGKLVPIPRDAFARAKTAYMAYLLTGKGEEY